MITMLRPRFEDYTEVLWEYWSANMAEGGARRPRRMPVWVRAVESASGRPGARRLAAAIEGKVVVVTGATSGIGRDCALKTGPRPAAYVFTNSYCSTCPMAFDALHARIRASGKTVELAAVVMDVAGAQALAHVHHYTGATKVYAFDGFEPEIRQTVDPQWHNITPYVVLIDRKGAVQRVIGPPSAAQLKAWRL